MAMLRAGSRGRPVAMRSAGCPPTGVRGDPFPEEGADPTMGARDDRELQLIVRPLLTEIHHP
jgi:hypothetical protein